MNHQQMIPTFTTSSTIPDQPISNNLLLSKNVEYNYGLGSNNNLQPLEAFVSPPPMHYLMFGGVNHHDQASSSSEGSCSQISHGNYSIFCDGGGLQMKQEESNKIGFITNEYGNRSEITYHSTNKFMLDFGSSKSINGGDHNYVMDATWNNDHIDHHKTKACFGHSNNVIATATTSSNTPLEYDSLEEIKQLIRVNNDSLMSLNDENKTKESEEEEEEERMRKHMYFY